MSRETPQNPPSAKVIDLNARPVVRETTATPPSSLQAKLVQQIQEAMGKSLASMFKTLDDDLYRRSEQDKDYFNALRELRKRQPLITRKFLEKIEASTSSGLKPKGSPGTMGRPTEGIRAQTGELSLVDENELEETIAITQMVASAESALGAEIHALRERCAMLRGGVAPEQVHIPASPGVLAETFQEVIAELGEVAVSVKIVIFKHFEKQVMGALGPLYHEMNDLLAKAGVLPNLKPAPLVRNHTEPNNRRREDQLPGAVPGQGRVSAGPQDAANAAAWEEFKSLWQDRQGGAGTAMGPVVDMRELLQTLTALREIQNLVGTMKADGIAPMQLKEHLLEKLGKGTHSEKSLGQHEQVVDAVGLMFDTILKDKNLPSEMQALLLRLQLPFIKVAILEPALFAQENHPARKLLDVLGEAAKGWTSESDRDKALFNKVKTMVDVIVEEFVDDPQIFERQKIHLESFLAEIRKKAEVTEKRSEESLKGREKLEQAQREVAEFLNKKIENQGLPEEIRSLLQRHWSHYMVLVWLQGGVESSAYKSASFFTQKLVDAGTTIDPAIRKALVSMTPTLLKQMDEGLSKVGFQEDDLRRMNTYVKSYLEGQKTGAMPPVQVLSGAATVLKKPEPATPKPKCRPESLEKVKALKLHQWVEWVEPSNGKKMRGKIAWISSFSGKMLLVTMAGVRLGEKSQEELACLLEQGQARLIDDKPLVQRTMGSILDRLRGRDVSSAS